MSSKQMTTEELNGLIIETLYATGPINGGDLMSRTGITGPEPMKSLVTSLIEAGYLGQEGKGKDATFGLTEEGITLAEEELGLGQPEEAAEEGEEESIVYDDEFSQEPPAKAAAARVAPARVAGKAAAAKQAPAKAAPARAASSTKAAPAASKAQVLAAKAAASTKSAPAKAPAKVATKVVAQEEVEDKILVYANLDDYTVEELQNEVDVAEDNARAFVESAAKLKDGSVDLKDPYAILASLLLRTVGRLKRRIKNGNKRPARS